MAKPKLIRHVHRFECDVLHYSTTERFHWTNFSEVGLSDLKESERLWIREHLPEGIFGKEFCDGWFEKMFSPTNWDAVVAFELCLFSKNLTYLWIEQYWGLGKYPYLHSVLKQARSCPDLCPNLRETMVSYTDPEKCWGLHMLVPFLKIRSVTTFNAERISENGFYYGRASFIETLKPMAFDHVTQINLSSANLSSASLGVLLHCFRNLQRFTYTHFTTLLERIRA